MWGKDRETGQKFVSSANSQIHSYITYFIYPSTGINNSKADLNFVGSFRECCSPAGHMGYRE